MRAALLAAALAQIAVAVWLAFSGGTAIALAVVLVAASALTFLASRRLTADPAPAVQSANGFGSYRLLSPLGAGGMGEVWKATHQMLARRAAIKLVRPITPATSERQRDQWVKRFQREANVIAGLQSPHTIYLYDFGVAPDGQFYYVMELLDGISLQTLVETFGPQPPARIRAILLQICESLEEAHQQSLVHRDLKPSNVMVCKLGLRHDFVKVLDFGLAKCAACEDAGQLTMDNVGMGTPGYIAPEVALGEPNIDGRVDIYCLGCVAYFLMTGALVFAESNPMTMAIMHVQTPPTPPSARTELPIPADLEQIVMRCLEKKPADRPSSAREVAEMLEACDVPAWSEDAAMTWWARNLPTTSSLRVTGDAAAPETATR
jgi:serine/threonine-protein kinase